MKDGKIRDLQVCDTPGKRFLKQIYETYTKTNGQLIITFISLLNVYIDCAQTLLHLCCFCTTIWLLIQSDDRLEL